MEGTFLSFLLLVSFLGSPAKQDLGGKVFIFPAASDTSHVALKDRPQQPLKSFTLCMRIYTDLTRPLSLFSYATKKHDDEILLFKPRPSEYRLYMGEESVTFSTGEKQTRKPTWEHICVSWDSATGLVAFWLDLEPLPRKGLRKGYSVPVSASIVLGQDQDTFGGGFDAAQSFVGEIGDVYMADRVLTHKEIRAAHDNLSLLGLFISWGSLDYEVRGYVCGEPSLFPATYSSDNKQFKH